MCFSTNASFGSGIILATIGIITIKKTKKPSHLFLACIPLLFAVQQVSEGFVWLALQLPGYAKWLSLPVHVFMIFAHVIWPVWIVLAVRSVEQEIAKKKALSVLLIAAVLLSVSEIYSMIVYPTGADITGHHVNYIFVYPKSYLLVTEIVYGITTLAPCFISSVRRMWLLGMVFIISFTFSAVFYKTYLLSIWCFFAALLSFIIYVIIDGDQRSTPATPGIRVDALP